MKDHEIRAYIFDELKNDEIDIEKMFQVIKSALKERLVKRFIDDLASMEILGNKPCNKAFVLYLISGTKSAWQDELEALFK